MNDTKYNGWANYQTWCVNLWLNNDEPSYNMLKSCQSAEEVKNLVEGYLDLVPSVGGMFNDLLTNALNHVNYDEIFKAVQND